MADISVQAFQEACRVLHGTQSTQEDRASADAYLREVGGGASPYELMLAVLNDVHSDAACQALACIFMRGSLLRSWSALEDQGASMKQELKMAFVRALRLPVEGDAQLARREPYVLALLFQLVAAMIKKDWLSDVQGSVTWVYQYLSQSNSKYEGLIFIRELVGAFGMEQANTQAVASDSLASQINCLRLFELNILRMLFDYALAVLNSGRAHLNDVFHGLLQSDAKAATSVEELHLALVVVELILSWNFQEIMSESEAALTLSAAAPMRERLLEEASGTRKSVKPGPLWRDVLLAGNTVPELLELYGALSDGRRELGRLQVNVAVDVARGLAASQEIVLRCLTQLCSLKGKIFEDDFSSRLPFLGVVVKSAVVLLERSLRTLESISASDHKQQGIVDEEDVAQISLLVQRIAVNFGLNLLLLLEQPLCQSMFELLAKVAVQLLNSNYVDVVTTYTSEAFELVVETWSHLVEGAQMLPNLQKYVTQRMPCTRADAEATLRPYCGALVEHYVTKRLEFGRLEIERGGEFQEQFHGEVQLTSMLTSVAQLARICARDSCSLMLRACQERLGAFQALAREWRGVESTVSLGVLQEELFWLVQFVGYTLSDATDECIPPHMLKLSRGFDGNVENDLVVALSNCLFQLTAAHLEVLQACTEGAATSGKHPSEVEKPPLLSPLLLTTMMEMLARWSSVYLMPSEAMHSEVAPNIWNTFGQAASGGTEALQMLVQASHTVLVLWSEEGELCEASCDVLRAMATNTRVRPHLIAAPVWWAFADVYHSNETVARMLSPAVLVTLARVICVALAEGPAASDQERLERFQTLVKPTRSLLQRVSQLSQQELHAMPLALSHHLSICLLQLQGFAQSNGAYAFPYAFEAIAEMFPVLLLLVQVCATQCNFTIVSRIVRIFSCLGDSELYYLEEARVCHFMAATGELLAAYFLASMSHLETMFATDAKKAEAAAELPEDASDDVMAVVGLLECLNRVDDFCLDDGHFRQAQHEAGKVLVFGVKKLLPLVNPAVFSHFPRFAFPFYSLLQELVMRHEALLAEHLGDEYRVALVRSLALGVAQQDERVVKLSLELVVSVVVRSGWINTDDLSVLFAALFDLLLFETFGVQLLRLLSNAVFVCVVANCDMFEQMALSFISSQESQQDALLQCFQALKTARGVQLVWDAENKARFQENVEAFVVQARSLVQQVQRK